MSLLDGLAEQLGVGRYDPALEAEEELELDQSYALEAAMEAIDKFDQELEDGELSEADIRAILDDNNPDNVAADIEMGEENPGTVGGDELSEEVKALEALLDEINGEDTEDDLPDEEDDPILTSIEDDDNDCSSDECEAPMECGDAGCESHISVEEIFKLI